MKVKVQPGSVRISNSIRVPRTRLAPQQSLHTATGINLLQLGRGNGKAKLLTLHGGPGLDYSYFLPYLEPLASRIGLYFYVQGTSGKTSLQGLLAELDEVIRAIGKPLIVLGHSFGAALLLEYLRIPSRNVQGIILSSWMHDTSWVSRYAERFSPDEDSEDTYASDAQYRDATVAAAARYFTPPFIETGKTLLQNIRYNAALSNQLWQDFFATFDGKEVLGRLQVAALSLTGQQDQIVDVEHVREGVRMATNMSTYEIPNVGHFPFVENAAEFNRLTLDFISRVTERSKS